ncbi:MAG: hypothetical protein J6B92_12605 [Paraprevotella sp.]|nr:hypothetical protein [Paraprevotella sp.]
MEKNQFIGINISKKILDVVIYTSSKHQPDASNYNYRQFCVPFPETWLKDS